MNAAVLSAEEIRRAVPMADAIAAVREGLIGLSRGEFEMPGRTTLGDGRFFVMSAHHAPTTTAIVKTLTLNFSRNPAIVGTVIWYDGERVNPVLADAGTVTSLRTGAASGVATDLLAPPEAATLTVIGSGAQAADQVRAVCTVRSLSTIRLVDRLSERAEGLAAQLRIELPSIQILAETDAESAVADADIICCATTAAQPLFALAALKPDVHVNAIGAFRPTMRELPDELLADVGVIYVDQKDAALKESGEIIHALASGAIVESSLMEIGQALGDGAVVRSGRTVFKTVGVAMEDWAVARLLAERYPARLP